MEQRKFLKLTKHVSNKPILIPIDSILSIEEMEDNSVRVTFSFHDDIRHVFVKESIEDITTRGFVFVIL